MPEIGGDSPNGYAVRGISQTGVGVSGWSKISGRGTEGYSYYGAGAYGYGYYGPGVFGESPEAAGVYGHSRYGQFAGRPQGGLPEGIIGVRGYSGVFGDGLFGVSGYSSNYVGVYGATSRVRGGVGVVGAGPPPAWAGAFEGDVWVSGNLTVTRGHIPFKIDHPLDPPKQIPLAQRRRIPGDEKRLRWRCPPR